MSELTTVALLCCLASRAHSWAAPSIWRRLLMHALACEVVRALMKLGIAIAASKPMMATTIMISTSLKPDLRIVLTFILVFLPFFLSRRERSHRRVMYNYDSVHELPVANRPQTLTTLPRNSMSNVIFAYPFLYRPGHRGFNGMG